MNPEYDPDYGNPYYDDENWCDEDQPAYVPDEPDEIEDYYPEDENE